LRWLRVRGVTALLTLRVTRRIPPLRGLEQLLERVRRQPDQKLRSGAGEVDRITRRSTPDIGAAHLLLQTDTSNAAEQEVDERRQLSRRNEELNRAVQQVTKSKERCTSSRITHV
jgi:hypothetical protein